MLHPRPATVLGNDLNQEHPVAPCQTAGEPVESA